MERSGDGIHYSPGDITMAEEKNTIDGFFCPSRIFIGGSDKSEDPAGKPGKSRNKKVKEAQMDTGFFDWLAPNDDRLQPLLDPMRYHAHSVLLDILNAIEPPPLNVLDLGCGTGMMTSQILELLPDAHVYAVDGSIAMLQAAQINLDQYSGQITLAKADFRDPWEEIFEEPIDAIIHYNALHHLPHDALREVYSRLVKILRPGGWFLHGDFIEQKLPDAVERIATKIREFQQDAAISDMDDSEDLLNEFDRVRKADEASGRLVELPAMPEQQIAWLLEAGFEFATRVFQDWQVSLFLARKPE